MKHTNSPNTTVFLLIVSLVAGVMVYVVSGAVLTLKSRASSNTLSVTPTLSSTPSPSIPPTSIHIPKINKNLLIKPASVHGNDWDMFPDAAAWLSTSAVPGKGNVILYAHNWKTLWRDLYLLKPGDAINIYHENSWKQYVVRESRDVDLHDVAAVLSDANQLTLYTCEGNFDQKRRVVYADPVR